MAHDKAVLIQNPPTADDAAELERRLDAKSRAMYGHVVGRPHPDSLKYLHGLLQAKDHAQTPERAIVGTSLDLLNHLRGELSETSYAALARVLCAVIQHSYLRETAGTPALPQALGTAQIAKDKTTGQTVVTFKLPAGALPGVHEVFDKDDPAIGGPDCPCVGCGVRRAAILLNLLEEGAPAGCVKH